VPEAVFTPVFHFLSLSASAQCLALCFSICFCYFLMFLLLLSNKIVLNDARLTIGRRPNLLDGLVHPQRRGLPHQARRQKSPLRRPEQQQQRQQPPELPRHLECAETSADWPERSD